MDQGRQKSLLDRAIDEWQAVATVATDDERLPDAARARILRQARSRRESGPKALLLPLFLPARRFALAAALPALLVTLGLGYLLAPGDRLAPGLENATMRLHVDKVGDEVVLLIANGDRPHRVYKSSRPNSLPSESVGSITRGSFRDRLDGADLVFYRVE